MAFISLSGVMAMVDAAVLSITHAEVDELIQNKKWGARSLKKITKRLSRAVVVIVILSNTINILGPILVGQKAIELYGSYIIGIITALLTFGSIIFSEIIPKSIGAHHAPLISRISAPFILTLSTVLYPIVMPLEKLTNFFKMGKRVIGSEHQIRYLANKGRKEGHIESDEGQLVHRAFLLNDKSAADIMTPLKDIVGVHEDDTIREAADKVLNNTHSRYPIFGASINDVCGFAISKDILEAITEEKDNELIKTLMRDILIVQSTDKADDLMELFKDKYIHIAIVQEDEHTVGLVTLEDVLEELVGEIEDEQDRD
ncbi:hemolysin family protein [Patescibacteria group bacterium]|nr:hemolysin family protein [Patescibacteria group bacterium]MBU1123678.1 hemolysin family protein [Patescibacteria group bacterium]